jgi:hypothetical protein
MKITDLWGLWTKSADPRPKKCVRQMILALWIAITGILASFAFGRPDWLWISTFTSALVFQSAMLDLEMHYRAIAECRVHELMQALSETQGYRNAAPAKECDCKTCRERSN